MMEPHVIEGIGAAVGASAAPAPERTVQMGQPLPGMPAHMLLARRDAVRGAFDEGFARGERHVDQAWAWKRSRALALLTSGMDGIGLVGESVICDDPRAAGRAAWHIIGVHRQRAWLTSEGVDLIVPLDSLRSLVTLRSFDPRVA